MLGGGCFGLTCDGLRVPSTLAASDEDDISLARSDIVALQKEEFIDTVVLKRCNLDNGSYRAGEALLDDEVLLALDLNRRDEAGVNEAGPMSLRRRRARVRPGVGLTIDRR